MDGCETEAEYVHASLCDGKSIGKKYGRKRKALFFIRGKIRVKKETIDGVKRRLGLQEKEN